MRCVKLCMAGFLLMQGVEGLFREVDSWHWFKCRRHGPLGRSGGLVLCENFEKFEVERLLPILLKMYVYSKKNYFKQGQSFKIEGLWRPFFNFHPRAVGYVTENVHNTLAPCRHSLYSLDCRETTTGKVQSCFKRPDCVFSVNNSSQLTCMLFHKKYLAKKIKLAGFFNQYSPLNKSPTLWHNEYYRWCFWMQYMNTFKHF